MGGGAGFLPLFWMKVSEGTEVWIWFGWEAEGEQTTWTSLLAEGIAGLNWW